MLDHYGEYVIRSSVFGRSIPARAPHQLPTDTPERLHRPEGRHRLAVLPGEDLRRDPAPQSRGDLHVAKIDSRRRVVAAALPEFPPDRRGGAPRLAGDPLDCLQLLLEKELLLFIRRRQPEQLAPDVPLGKTPLHRRELKAGQDLRDLVPPDLQIKAKLGPGQKTRRLRDDELNRS